MIALAFMVLTKILSDITLLADVFENVSKCSKSIHEMFKKIYD